MYIEKDEWNRIYEIEEKVIRNIIYKDDMQFLLKIIYKLNGNMIDSKTHNKIQEMIDSKEIPQYINISEDELENGLRNLFKNICL